MLRFPVIQLPAHFVSPKAKRWLIATAGCAAVALFTYLFVSGFPTISAQSPEGGVFVEGKIELAPGGDLNSNNAVDAGDTVALTFRIRNLTDTEYPFATLQTGVDSAMLYDIWNLSGAASLSEVNNTISFPNLRLPAHSKQFVTVEGTLKYFTEGQHQLILTPQLLDRHGSPLGTVIPNDHAIRPVGLWIGELPPWIAFPGISPSPSPTPEATPEATPEPTATLAPEITPEPTAIPTPVVTDTPILTPTIDPSPTPEPTITPSPAL